MAQELGEMLGQGPIPTEIFRCCSHNPKDGLACVEVFVPAFDEAVVNDWIKNGVGTHMAFLVKSRTSIYEIKDLMIESNFRMPKFMNNEPMDNPKAGTLTVYFDLIQNSQRVRIEFVYMNNLRVPTTKP
jgi:hypothetical protein